MSRLLLPGALLLAAGACDGSPRPSPGKGVVTLKGRKIETFLFTTEKDRRGAPAGFSAAGEDRGFLMCWPRARFIKIESADGRDPFDVAFLDAAGKVLEVQRFVPGHPEGFMSGQEARFALFVDRGLLEKVGAGVGETVSLPPEAAQSEDLPQLQIGPHAVHAELALSERERQHGLMFRPRMSANEGMLFAYADEQPRGFWMKNTLIPLDIAFFKADGTLLNVNETPTAADPRAGPWPPSRSDGSARFILEMNLGWFRRQGLVDDQGHPKSPVKIVMPPQALQGSF